MKNKGLLSPRQIILRHEATDLLSERKRAYFQETEDLPSGGRRLCATKQQPCF